MVGYGLLGFIGLEGRGTGGIAGAIFPSTTSLLTCLQLPWLDQVENQEPWCPSRYARWVGGTQILELLIQLPRPTSIRSIGSRAGLYHKPSNVRDASKRQSYRKTKKEIQRSSTTGSLPK